MPDERRPLMTIEDMKRKLVVLMAGCAAGRLAGTESPRDMEVAFRQSYELAMRICDFECAEGDRSQHAVRLTSDALLEAVSILGRYSAEHERLTALLLEKGELTAADINSLTPVEPREG